MKTLLKRSILLICIALHCSLQACKMKEKDSPSESSIQEELYYGLTANEILAIEGKDIKSFREKHDISPIDWFDLRNKLRKEKMEKEIKRLQMNTDSIYNEVDKKLDVK